MREYRATVTDGFALLYMASVLAKEVLGSLPDAALYAISICVALHLVVMGATLVAIGIRKSKRMPITIGIPQYYVGTNLYRFAGFISLWRIGLIAEATVATIFQCATVSLVYWINRKAIKT